MTRAALIALLLTACGPADETPLLPVTCEPADAGGLIFCLPDFEICTVQPRARFPRGGPCPGETLNPDGGARP